MHACAFVWYVLWQLHVRSVVCVDPEHVNVQVWGQGVTVSHANLKSTILYSYKFATPDRSTLNTCK